MMIAVLSTLLSFGVSDLATSQQAPVRIFAPSDLVGQWDGRWECPRLGDAVYVTIKSVDREEVAGTIYIKCNAPYCNRDLTFAGTFRGGSVAGSFATLPGYPPATYEWEIGADGKSMAGWGQIGCRASMSLTKTR
jgi:hypothetical protein